MNASGPHPSNHEKWLVGPRTLPYFSRRMRKRKAFWTNAGILLLALVIGRFFFTTILSPAGDAEADARRFLDANFAGFLDQRAGWYAGSLWTRATDSFRKEWPVEKLSAYFREWETRLGSFEGIRTIRRGTGGHLTAAADYRVDYDIDCLFARGPATVSIGLAHQSSHWAFDRFIITPAPSSP